VSIFTNTSKSELLERSGTREGRPAASGFAKLGLLLFGLILSVVLGELLLQGMSLVAGQYATRDRDPSSGSDAIRVLCVGDSHTYGLPLPEEESYPSQLEVRLSALYPGREVEVVNLGVPGLNSTFVSLRLERQIYQLDPDLVIVWAGINNLWNLAEQGRARNDGPWFDARRALQRFRLFRLASIAWYNGTGHQYDPLSRGAWYDPADPPARRLAPGMGRPNPVPSLARDLKVMARTAQSMERPIIFVTYPLRGQRGISGVIESIGGQFGVEVVNSARAYRRAIRDGYARVDLIDERAGPHPSAILYGYVVDSLVSKVTGSLAAWHGFESPVRARAGLAVMTTPE
jgi:hypothetical protein